MKIKPVGNRMVLEIKKLEEKEVSGIIIINNEESDELIGDIIALSDELKSKEIFSIGDRVIYKDFKGQSIKSNDKELLIIDEEDVLGIIE